MLGFSPEWAKYNSPGLRRELSRTANDEGVAPWVGKDKKETVRVKVFFNVKTYFRTE